MACWIHSHLSAASRCLRPWRPSVRFARVFTDDRHPTGVALGPSTLVPVPAKRARCWAYLPGSCCIDERAAFPIATCIASNPLAEHGKWNGMEWTEKQGTLRRGGPIVTVHPDQLTGKNETIVR